VATVKLRNVNPLGQVDLPLVARQGEPLGEHGVGCLEPGEVFAVDSKHAGRPPSGEPGTEDYDPGEGLLAQVSNYELADGSAPTKPAKKATKPRKRAVKKTAPAKPVEHIQTPAPVAADTVTEV
jgi:hypothetical protein